MTSADLTVLLAAAGRGDRSAFDRCFSLLYDELARLAHAQRGRWQGNETLNTAALLHEAYLKLAGGGDRATAQWDGRRHFFALASQVMRQVLVNYAEARRAGKRGGDAVHLGLDDLAGGEQPADDAAETDRALALNEALERLATTDERQARILECRFFAGLSIPETAEALGISEATVKREFAAATARLRAELAAG